MAIWQYHFDLLPSEYIIPGETNFQIFVEELGFNDKIFWENSKYTIEDFEPIGKLLPVGESWSKKLTVFGDLTSNCFEVWCKNGIVYGA